MWHFIERISRIVQYKYQRSGLQQRVGVDPPVDGKGKIIINQVLLKYSPETLKRRHWLEYAWYKCTIIIFTQQLNQSAHAKATGVIMAT